jgi:hypothetical protein
MPENDSISFYYTGNVGDFLLKLKHFGENYILRSQDKILGEDFSRHSKNSIRNHKGEIISFRNLLNNYDVNAISQFIHRMKKDNAQILAPLIKKYVTIIFLFKGKKFLLTGYANLRNYINFIKTPSRELLDLLNEVETDVDYIIELSGKNPEIRLKSSETIDNKIVVDLFFDGKIKTKAEITKTLEPYVLMTTKPIRLLNQKLPYIISSQKNTPIFITPLLFNTTEYLKKLKGGVNLLT